jgi:hypothetical protein
VSGEKPWKWLVHFHVLSFLPASQQRLDYSELLSQVSLPGMDLGLINPQSAFLEKSVFRNSMSDIIVKPLATRGCAVCCGIWN